LPRSTLVEFDLSSLPGMGSLSAGAFFRGRGRLVEHTNHPQGRNPDMVPFAIEAAGKAPFAPVDPWGFPLFPSLGSLSAGAFTIRGRN
jgi:hypothetical protein